MAGKVAKYGKPEEMEKRINEYFAQFENPEPLRDKNGEIIKDRQGNAVIREKGPTQSGLALFLGFENRSSLWDYEQKPTFARVIKQARTRVAEFLERQILFGRNPSGAQFLISNLGDGWRDIKQIEDNRQAPPPVALIQFIGGQKNKAISKTILPTIDIQAEEIPSLPKPKHKASTGKKLGRPSKKEMQKRARIAKQLEAKEKEEKPA